ncbi:peptidylprolyl isomerase [Caldithrix abyssi]
MIKVRLVLIFSLFILAAACKKQQSEANWLARVNDRLITVDEFRLFYELDPNFGVYSSGVPALKTELDRMIDQHLALILAKERGLLKEPPIKRAIQWEKRQAVLRAYYRTKIGQNIHIEQADLRKAYVQRNEQVYLRHLFTKDEKMAQKWFKELKKDSSLFRRFARQAFHDSILAKNGGVLGWLPIAELDEDLAKGVDTLRQGQISRPIRTRWGYHIVQILNRKKPAIFREDEFLKQRPLLEKWLRRKKGLALSQKFIAQTIGRMNPQPDPQLFLKMWLAIKGDNNLEKMQLTREHALTSPLLEKIRRAMKNDLASPFIHFRGGSVSLAAFLGLLQEIPLTQRPRFRTPRELSLQLAKIFRDDYLYRQALKEGLDNDPQVLAELQRFKENQLYYYFVNEIVDTLKIPAVVVRYFKTNDQTAIDQFPEITKFHTLQEWQFNKAEQILHQRLRRSAPEIEIDVQKLQEENKRINWDRPIRMFMIRKPS